LESASDSFLWKACCCSRVYSRQNLLRNWRAYCSFRSGWKLGLLVALSVALSVALLIEL
jgi:hypothetical protein